MEATAKSVLEQVTRGGPAFAAGSGPRSLGAVVALVATIAMPATAVDPPASRAAPATALGSRLPSRVAPPAAPSTAAQMQSSALPAVQSARQRFTAVPRFHAVIPGIERGSAFAPGVDLRPRIAQLGLGIRDQGDRGTCSVFAMTFLLEYTQSRGMIGNDLSEEYMNTAANIASGALVDGDYFDKLDAGVRKFGMVPEAALRYQPTFVPTATLPAELTNQGKAFNSPRARFIKPWDNRRGANAQELAAVLASLDRGVPVAGGFWWPVKTAWNVRNVGGVHVMDTPPLDDKMKRVKDGHSVVLVGYFRNATFPGGGYVVFRNSWGPGWGDQGYGYMSFEYVQRFANDLVVYG